MVVHFNDGQGPSFRHPGWHYDVNPTSSPIRRMSSAPSEVEALSEHDVLARVPDP